MSVFSDTSHTTLKLCRILRKITEFLREKGNVNIDFKHLVFKKIYDNIYFTLQKNKSLEHTQVETLYLLVALRELGKEYWLDADVLRQYLCIGKHKDTEELFFKGSLNYFAITVLLFYIQDKKRYTLLRKFLQNHIRMRFNEDNPGKKAELVYLLFDVLSCPYLDTVYKEEILALHGVTDQRIQNDIINNRKHWFTKWTDFDFGKELDAKISQEVY